MISRQLLAALIWGAFAILATGVNAASAEGAGGQVGGIKISDAWVRETPIGGQSGGAYLRITNTGSEPDRLVRVDSPVAKRVEVRETLFAQDTMKRRNLADGLEIPAGGSVQMTPEGYHLIFLDLVSPFKPDQPVQATLQFAKAGTVTIQFKIRARQYW